jgi:hypothetical protein
MQARLNDLHILRRALCVEHKANDHHSTNPCSSQTIGILLSYGSSDRGLAPQPGRRRQPRDLRARNDGVCRRDSVWAGAPCACAITGHIGNSRVSQDARIIAAVGKGVRSLTAKVQGQGARWEPKNSSFYASPLSPATGVRQGSRHRVASRGPSSLVQRSSRTRAGMSPSASYVARGLGRADLRASRRANLSSEEFVRLCESCPFGLHFCRGGIAERRQSSVRSSLSRRQAVSGRAPTRCPRLLELRRQPPFAIRRTQTAACSPWCQSVIA